jgi:peptidyl-prolyl cis-trans isomerase SurA
MTKKTRWMIALLGLVAALALGQQVVEEIVAVVNDDVITLSQLRKEYDLRLQALQAQNIVGEEHDKAVAQIKATLLDNMITDTLLLQLAREKNLNVTEQVKNAIENIKKENTITSDEDLKRALRSQGLEWEPWLKQVEETILRQSAVMNEVGRSIALDEAEVVDYYKKHPADFTEPDEYTIRAVYLATADADPAALETRKAEISVKIKGGSDLGEVSSELSDPPLKGTKGELGTIKKGELDKAVQGAVEKMKKGELSEWVQARTGWYLLKLEDKKDSRVKTFEESRRQIEDKLYGEKQAVKLNEFITDLKKKSYVKILKPDPLKDRSTIS